MIKPLIILILTFALHNIVQCQENKIIRLANRDIERIVSKEIILENQNCTFSFLEQNENSYTRIASECRIYPVDEGIVIFDWLSQKVHFYNHENKYKFSINKRGKGPFEYTMIRKVILNKANVIAIWDSILKKIIEFDFDGNVVNEVRLQNEYDKVEFYEGNYYGIGQVDDAYELHELDVLGNTSKNWVLKAGKELDVCLKHKSFNNLFYLENKLCISVQPNTELCVLQEGKIQSVIEFVYGKNKISRKSLLASSVYASNRSEKTVFLSSISGSEKWLILNISYINGSPILLLNTNSSELIKPVFYLKLNRELMTPLIPRISSYQSKFHFLYDFSSLEESFESGTIESTSLKSFIQKNLGKDGLILIEVPEKSILD